MRTRFAPSPTGDLHIGSCRTALFNFLAAKHAGGEFKLRIEDTDKERNSESSLQSIKDGLEWLGLIQDGDIVMQSSEIQNHQDAVVKLIATGAAYHCYLSQNEIDAQKKYCEQVKKPYRYDMSWRPDQHDNELEWKQHLAKKINDNVRSVVRLKMPLNGTTEFEDVIRGKLSINNSELDDFVILRADGTPTYLLAAIVDDHNMGITHVIRGEDHITNTFKQIQIYKALGWEIPTFAHISLIHGEDGAKLSKRHMAMSVLSLRDNGYLPEAVNSYLVGLGWGHASSNYLTMQEMIEQFNITQVGKSPSRLDFAKLDNINHHFLQKRDDFSLSETVLSNLLSQPFEFDTKQLSLRTDIDLSSVEKLSSMSDVSTLVSLAMIYQMMPQLKPRAKTLVELIDSAKYLFKLPEFDDSAKEVLTQNFNLLGKLRIHFQCGGKGLSDFNLGDFKMKDAAITLRAALCGSKTSSGSMESIVEVLGKTEVISRLNTTYHIFTR
jgi:glutamyl-tRNA synthetase